MKAIFISDLKSGDNVANEPFLLYDVARRKTRDGRPYLLCTLRDNSGQLGGVFWDVPDYVDEWARPGVVVLVTGHISKYKDALQVNLTDLNPSEDADMGDFLPVSTRPRDEMVAELREIIAGLGEPWQGLVAHLLLDDAFLKQFASAPAARGMHHAYVGGLLEHTLSMTAVATMLADFYSYVNKDLLISGTLLHDMGKTMEYQSTGGFAFTEDGRMVGHIVRAIVMIETAAAQLNFPEDDLRQLVHLVASHHGRLEWGSPVAPKTLEAILLHQVDLLDSRVQGYFDHLNNESADNGWTLKNSAMFGSELRLPDDYPTDD